MKYANAFVIQPSALESTASADSAVTTMVTAIDRAKGNFHDALKAQCIKAVLALFKGKGSASGSALLVAKLAEQDGNTGHLVRSYLRRCGVKFKDGKPSEFASDYLTPETLGLFLKSVDFIEDKEESDSKKPATPAVWADNAEGVKKVKDKMDKVVKEIGKHNDAQLLAFVKWIIDTNMNQEAFNDFLVRNK